jgi:hypothetical protein
VPRRSTTNDRAATDHRTAANTGGASIADRSTRSNATGTVHTAGADDGACFHSIRDDETSDQAEEQDHVFHVLSLRIRGEAKARIKSLQK